MLNINDITRIYLGVQGENLARSNTIDMRPWLVEHPGGSVTIWHKRNGDAVPGPTGAVFDPEEGAITWSPTNTDTYVSGEGEAEIRLTIGAVIKKSRSVITGVSPSVTLAGQPLGSDWQSYIDAVDQLRSAAVTAKEDAEDSALIAEGFAVGEQDGTPVDSESPYYENNAKYYSGEAAESATDSATSAGNAQDSADLATTKANAASVSANQAYAYSNSAHISANKANGFANNAGIYSLVSEGYANGKQNGTAQQIGPYYQNNAEYFKDQASGSATAAARSATAASGSAGTASAQALVAEGYANGKQNGTPVGSGSPYYENNAKYYNDNIVDIIEEAAEEAAEAAVATATADAEAFAQESESWARGTKDGTPVTSDEPAYNNNAKYYADAAEDSAEDSEAYAIGKRNGVDVTSGDLAYHNNSKYYAEQAGISEDDAEAWATGKKDGTDVPSTDPAYHNNARYYRELAQGDANAAAGSMAAAAASAQQAAGSVTAAETAQQAAEDAAQEAIETVVAAQGPGICYVDSNGIPYVLE